MGGRWRARGRRARRRAPVDRVAVGDPAEHVGLLEVAERRGPVGGDAELGGTDLVGHRRDRRRCRTRRRRDLRSARPAGTDEHAGLLAAGAPGRPAAARAARARCRPRRPPSTASGRGASARRVVEFGRGTAGAASAARRRTTIVQPVVTARRANSSSGTTVWLRRVRSTRRVSQSRRWSMRPSSPIRSASEKTIVTVGSARSTPTNRRSFAGYQTSSWSARAIASAAAPRGRRRSWRVDPEPGSFTSMRTGNGAVAAKALEQLDGAVVGSVVLDHQLVGKALLCGERVEEGRGASARRSRCTGPPRHRPPGRARYRTCGRTPSLAVGDDRRSGAA